MATAKKKSTKKPAVKRAQTAKKQAVPRSFAWRVRRFFVNIWKKITNRVRFLMNRRPHRSFHRTMRRDYTRSLKLPGYWAFTNHVRKTLWQRKRIFIGLAAGYAILTLVLVGIVSQQNYAGLSDTLRSSGEEAFQGNWGELGKASLLMVTGVTSTFNNSLTEAQQMYAAILLLFTWLTTVWLLRMQLAGQKPRLRDGVYNAGAPIIPTFLVTLVALAQLLPVALAAIAFGAATATGLLDGGVEAMLFWVGAALLTVLSLYWITSTLIALVVVTLPGMYPMQAIRTGGDLVIGRRLRILFRWLWLLFSIIVAWIVIVIPIILFDTWLKGVLPVLNWLPVVPVILLIMGTLTAIWAAAYVYLLYRKVVDDDASPA